MERRFPLPVLADIAGTWLPRAREGTKPVPRQPSLVKRPHSLTEENVPCFITLELVGHQNVYDAVPVTCGPHDNSTAIIQDSNQARVPADVNLCNRPSGDECGIPAAMERVWK